MLNYDYSPDFLTAVGQIRINQHVSPHFDSLKSRFRAILPKEARNKNITYYISSFKQKNLFY